MFTGLKAAFKAWFERNIAGEDPYDSLSRLDVLDRVSRGIKVDPMYLHEFGITQEED